MSMIDVSFDQDSFQMKILSDTNKVVDFMGVEAFRVSTGGYINELFLTIKASRECFGMVKAASTANDYAMIIYKEQGVKNSMIFSFEIEGRSLVNGTMSLKGKVISTTGKSK